MSNARLHTLYKDKLRPDLKDKLGLKNISQVPTLEKVVINVGVKEAVKDSKVITSVEKVISRIAGQHAVRTLAHKSIAGFKIREGMPLGVMVTLRGKRMYAFLDKLIHVALPRVRDFQGVTSKFDRQGNYNLGLKEWTIFPEVESTSGNEIVMGCNITINIRAASDKQAHALLASFGMPFKKNDK